MVVGIVVVGGSVVVVGCSVVVVLVVIVVSDSAIVVSSGTKIVVVINSVVLVVVIRLQKYPELILFTHSSFTSQTFNSAFPHSSISSQEQAPFLDLQTEYKSLIPKYS